MKKFEAKIFIWASPVFCNDPERSLYDYSLLNSKVNYRKLLYAFIFFSKSIFTGLKKIKKGQIQTCEFIYNSPINTIVYSPNSFINRKEFSCKYFPSLGKNSSFLIIDAEKKLQTKYLQVLVELWKYISPEFCKFNKNNKFLKRIINWFLFCSYFISLDILSHYLLAIKVYELSKKYSKSKHICLHEMHSYSRIIYGILNISKVKSITIQHALIHQTRLLFDLRRVLFEPYLPDTIFIWSEESMKILRYFGWPISRIKFASTERFLDLSNLDKSIKDPKLLSSQSNTKLNYGSVLFLPSLLKDDFILSINAALIIRSFDKNLRIIIKLHPSFKLYLFETAIVFFLKKKSIYFAKEDIRELFKNKPLTFTYSSTAIYEAALYKCSSYFLPTKKRFDGNEKLLKKELIDIVKSYKKKNKLEEITNPLYISKELSNSFFGFERDTFLSIINI